MSEFTRKPYQSALTFCFPLKEAKWESNQICENSPKMSSDQGRGKSNLYNCAITIPLYLNNYNLDVLSLSIFPISYHHAITYKDMTM